MDSKRLRRLAHLTVWGLALGAFVWFGGREDRLAIIRHSPTSVMGQWGTSDLLLRQWAIAGSGQAIQEALADLPEGDVILFVGGGKNPEQSFAYFNVGYFGRPRRLASILCGQPGQPRGFFAPLPPDADKVAALVFYALNPPPEFSGGRQVSPQLRVVPYSKPVREITDWTCFCPH